MDLSPELFAFSAIQEAFVGSTKPVSLLDSVGRSNDVIKLTPIETKCDYQGENCKLTIEIVGLHHEPVGDLAGPSA